MSEQILFASVKFHTGPRKYAYRTHISDLVPDDEVVVDTKNGITIATFIEYTPPTDIATRSIIAKCDLDSMKDMRAYRASIS